MEQQLAALYGKLARQIAAMIPAQWDAVHYLGEVEKGKTSYSSVFYFRDTATGEFVQSNSMDKKYPISKSAFMDRWMQLNKILLEIYDCFAENGQPAWEQLSLSLEPSGKFKVNYLYDAMDGGDGPMKREVVWAYKTFGLTPPEGTYARKVLDEAMNA